MQNVNQARDRIVKKFSAVIGMLCVAVAGALMTADAVAQEGARVSDAQVFKDFGEKPGLVKIMDDFMIGLLSDQRTKPFFVDADQERVKEQLVEQICEILKGPCQYKGAKMTPVHKELGINREHFNALVEQLQLAMDKNGVPFSSQNKLLAVLAPMHRQIVTK
jgi:hemoglobin